MCSMDLKNFLLSANEKRFLKKLCLFGFCSTSSAGIALKSDANGQLYKTLMRLEQDGFLVRKVLPFQHTPSIYIPSRRFARNVLGGRMKMPDVETILERAYAFRFCALNDSTPLINYFSGPADWPFRALSYFKIQRDRRFDLVFPHKKTVVIFVHDFTSRSCLKRQLNFWIALDPEIIFEIFTTAREHTQRMLNKFSMKICQRIEIIEVLEDDLITQYVNTQRNRLDVSDVANFKEVNSKEI